MTGDTPRSDTRGIVNAPDLFARLRFRRRLPAEPLRPYLEHYWLIDGHLPEPYTTHVVPHPSVNLVFQRYNGKPEAELAGVGLGLFSHTMTGDVRVCGVQFRPGGFRPFLDEPVSRWTGLRVPVKDILADTIPVRDIVDPDDEDARVRALDEALLRLGPTPDPQANEAMELVARIRTNREIRRVTDLGVPVRSLQRLFSAYVGVSPKWVILRYRIHEALERAATNVDWARIAAELGYSDQAHLVRDFTHTVGVAPAAYARSASGGAVE